MPDRDLRASEEHALEVATQRVADCIRRRGRVLDLSGLGLVQLPDKITRLNKLTDLNLANNRLAAMPAEVLQLADLARLDLSHNPVSSLPPDIARLAALTRLDINHTLITALPAEIGRLAQLTRLFLAHNRLEMLPESIGELGHLTRLGLSHNRLATLPSELGRLAMLTRLDLSHNSLTGLPPGLGELDRLTVLDLSHNPLTRLPAELFNLSKLSVLHLSDTCLESLPPEVGNLDKLTELDLTRNHLASLPESLAALDSLERLFLHENPALHLAPSVLGPDPRDTTDRNHPPAKAILGFYIARQSGESQPLDEARLILLGRSVVGKTTIARALGDLPYHEQETRTSGISLSDITLEAAGRPVTVHVWDCSGSEATHALHPAFFSPRNLHAVVLTGCGHHEREDAGYWLDLLRASASDAQGQAPPVIVVMNQWNVPGCRPDLDRAALRELHPNIRGFIEMDCRAKKGIPALKAALSRELERMPWVGEPIPKPWQELRHAMFAESPYLTTAGYRALCETHGIHEQGQQDYLAEMLHHLGAVLRQADPNPSHGFDLILQPEWLIKHLYPLLHRAAIQQGLLHAADVDALIPRDKSPAWRDILIQVLMRAGIARAGREEAASGGQRPPLQLRLNRL
jgi:hypothetical protein